MTKPNQTSEDRYACIEQMGVYHDEPYCEKCKPKDQTLEDKIDNMLTWDIDGEKQPVLFRDEMKQAIVALVKTEVEKARIEMGDDMVALAQPRTFNKWTNKDAADFFIALGAYLKPIVDGEPEKQRLNEREDV